MKIPSFYKYNHSFPQPIKSMFALHFSRTCHICFRVKLRPNCGVVFFASFSIMEQKKMFSTHFCYTTSSICWQFDLCSSIYVHRTLHKGTGRRRSSPLRVKSTTSQSLYRFDMYFLLPLYCLFSMLMRNRGATIHEIKKMFTTVHSAYNAFTSHTTRGVKVHQSCFRGHCA